MIELNNKKNNYKKMKAGVSKDHLSSDDENLTHMI